VICLFLKQKDDLLCKKKVKRKKKLQKNRTTNIVATLVQEIETKIQKTNN